jgi:hypothetical protein
VGEKTEERRVERDILKEMFPYEASTPTGIRYLVFGYTESKVFC